MPGGPAARNTTEQHPFHLHGHHFWVLGSGSGPYNSSVEATLNLVNPMYRDTQTLPEGGWTVIRFVVSRQLTGPSSVSAQFAHLEKEIGFCCIQVPCPALPCPTCALT